MIYPIGVRRAFRRAAFRKFKNSRYYKPSRKSRSRRIFRRFIRRTAPKPELKATYYSVETVNIAPATPTTWNITPPNIVRGTGAFQRIGNQIKFVKVDCRMVISNNDSITGALAPTFREGQVRVVLWSPRIDVATTNTYMSAIGTNTLLDFNLITVYRDMIFFNAPQYTQRDTTDADPNPGPSRSRHFKQFSIRFPRKVFFADTTDFVDQEKFSMFITVTSTDVNFVVNTQARTWFLDA